MRPRAAPAHQPTPASLEADAAVFTEELEDISSILAKIGGTPIIGADWNAEPGPKLPYDAANRGEVQRGEGGARSTALTAWVERSGLCLPLTFCDTSRDEASYVGWQDRVARHYDAIAAHVSMLRRPGGRRCWLGDRIRNESGHLISDHRPVWCPLDATEVTIPARRRQGCGKRRWLPGGKANFRATLAAATEAGIITTMQEFEVGSRAAYEKFSVATQHRRIIIKYSEETIALEKSARAAQSPADGEGRRGRYCRRRRWKID